MSLDSFTDDLRLAHLLADRADAITMARFQAKDLKVQMKSDHTPVTDADREAEESMRAFIQKVRSRDAIIGEEFDTVGWGPREWILDPIDGTANYQRGVPVWATLIALRVDGIVRVGVVSAPALGRRWWAAEGEGAFVGKSLLKGARMRTSKTATVEDAFLSYSSVSGWISSGRGQAFVDLMRDCGRTRAFGDFWSYMMLAEGCVDIATEPELALHDMAALDIIVREAGGRFTSLDGADGPVGPGALATNGILHDVVLDRLRPDGTEDSYLDALE